MGVVGARLDARWCVRALLLDAKTPP